METRLRRRHEQMLVDEITSTVSMEDRSFLVDVLCRHREILRREANFLREEVKSRGFDTLAGKKAYMDQNRQSSNSNSNDGRRTTISSELLESTKIHESVGVPLPYLVTTPQQSLELLLQETHHLRYRIQSLASILREFGSVIPISSDEDHKVKMRQLFLMSQAALNISKSMRQNCCSKQDEAAASSSERRLHRAHWESIWGSNTDRHGVFDDITTLSPMHFTPCTPGIAPYSATICAALQIYSLKIVQLNVNLNWPLRVYGVVAARDTVDRNRNFLFYRSRANPQLVTENDPFLQLTGPSRAIVSASNHVIFEVELKIKYPGSAEEPHREDRALFFRTYNWHSARDTTPLLRGFACSAELSLEELPRAIQATIVGVRLVTGSWPSAYGCRISCYVSDDADEEDREVELLNCCSLDDAKKSPVGSDGYIALARNVVSAQLETTLEVFIQAKSRFGDAPHISYVEFPVQQYCQTSKASCSIVECEIEVVFAWSLLVKEKLDLMLYC